MEHDHEMHAHDSDETYTIYPPNLHTYRSSPPSFMVHPGPTRERFLSSDTFGAPHRQDHHEAGHVYDSPQLTLDPSTLDLRSNSNQEPRPSSANTSGSNNTTPTGSLRLTAYNLPNISSGGVTTRRRARAALENLQIQIQVGIASEEQVHSPHHHQQQQQRQHQDHQHQDHHQHQQGDMHDVQMHPGEIQMHVDDRHDPGMIGTSLVHEHAQGETLSHHMFAMLPDASSQSEYYLTSDNFSNSPTNTSTPPDASPHTDIQAHSPTSVISSSPSVVMPRAFRPGSHGLGIPASRSIVPLTPAHGSSGQQLSPPHCQHPHLTSHPHMHPSPYYPLPHNSGSPGFPPTPTTSHHTQGSSSSSHSSGHTRYSFRGSPGPRFGRGHARSGSYGTVSTISVRSSSPASSVASAFTSLSGGAGGSAPPSTSGQVGSPTTYGENRDVQMSFANAPPRDPRGHNSDCHQVRSQSHPPLSMPTAHPAIGAYSALLPQSSKGVPQHGPGVYMTTSGGTLEDPRESMWPPHARPDGYLSPSLGPRMAVEVLHPQFHPKANVTRTPHRKQKLANSDRKAICMYAKQHPSARQEDIAARYNVERSTISKILKNKERWLGCPDDDAKVARKRKPRFDDLELVLKQWVEGMKPQGILLSDALIRSKAKEEARRLGILEDKFKASSGWLENFKHRVGIRKGKYIGRDLWPEGSDSEGDESSLPSKHLPDQRMVWQTDSAQSSEHPTKGTWDELTTENHARDAGGVKDESPPPLSQATSDQIALLQPTSPALDDHNDHGFNQASVQSQTPGARPTSQQSGRVGVGMRKTRSRTLAEAREAEAMLSGGPPSSPTVSSPTTTLTTVSSSAEQGDSNARGVAYNSPVRPSHISSPISDGREASAGLDAAIDFIGSQPHGFATPEEVAVLKKLSRKMSRAELPRHHSTSSMPSAWSGTGET